MQENLLLELLGVEGSVVVNVCIVSLVDIESLFVVVEEPEELHSPGKASL